MDSSIIACKAGRTKPSAELKGVVPAAETLVMSTPDTRLYVRKQIDIAVITNIERLLATVWTGVKPNANVQVQLECQYYGISIYKSAVEDLRYEHDRWVPFGTGTVSRERGWEYVFT